PLPLLKSTFGHNDFAYDRGQHKRPVPCIPYTRELCIAISGQDTINLLNKSCSFFIKLKLLIFVGTDYKSALPGSYRPPFYY
ncbi:hypothetical protein, partial [Flavobacterium aquariorum]|uniref:hypothetical protein n=1 Tax=Flavobacterium aquariorum TaxID=2217670 RepID=UPI001A9DE253